MAEETLEPSGLKQGFSQQKHPGLVMDPALLLGLTNLGPTEIGCESSLGSGVVAIPCNPKT